MSQDELNALSAEELQETIEKAKAALEAKQSEQREAVITEINRLAASIGVSVTIAGATPDGRKRTVAAKYRDGENSWSGRGLKPRWLRDRISQGRMIDEFAV